MPRQVSGVATPTVEAQRPVQSLWTVGFHSLIEPPRWNREPQSLLNFLVTKLNTKIQAAVNNVNGRNAFRCVRLLLLDEVELARLGRDWCCHTIN